VDDILAGGNFFRRAILPGWIDTPLTQAVRKVILRKGDCARLR
jgi:hypothetical protein